MWDSVRILKHGQDNRMCRTERETLHRKHRDKSEHDLRLECMRPVWPLPNCARADIVAEHANLPVHCRGFRHGWVPCIT